MATMKKVFFGSLFDLTSIEAQELVDGLRQQFDDHQDVPFISYDLNTKVFSCEIDSNDRDLVLRFKAQIDAFTTPYSRKPDEPLEHERLVLIEGTEFRDEASYAQEQERHQNFLVEVDDSDDSDFDETSENTLVYWKPDRGDISSLQVDIAEQIADSTGCFLIPDSAGNRIRLAYGNSKSALDKLDRLKPLIALIASHRSKVASRVNGNVLLLQMNHEPALKLTRPFPPLCSYNRIIVAPEQRPHLIRIRLGEVRLLEGVLRVTPPNLDLVGVSISDTQSSSQVFSAVDLPTLGNRESVNARPMSETVSQISDEVQRSASPTRHLVQKQIDRVEEWRENIDQTAVPTLPPEEPGTDPPKSTGRRVVAVDSDDEDEESQLKGSHSHVSGDGKLLVASRHIENDANESEIAVHQDKGKNVSLRHQSDEASNTVSAKQQNVLLMSKSRNDPQRVRPKGGLKSNNIFDLIGNDSSSGGQKSSSEHASSEASGPKVRQLNVTFEEPALHSQLSGSPKSVSKGYVSRPGSHNRKHSFNSRGESSMVPSNPRPGMSHPAAGFNRTQSSPPKHPSYFRQSGHLGYQQNQSYRRKTDLIDTTWGEPSDQPVAPPPGFDFTPSVPLQPAARPEALNQQNHQPIIDHEQRLVSLSTMSPSTMGFTVSRPTPFEYKPRPTVAKPNMIYLKQQAVSRLMAQITDGNQDESRNEPPDATGLPPNRVKKEDEHSTRKYHKSMSQGMAKPSKGNKHGNRQELKAEREARIAKAKADAYGETAPAKVPPKAQPKLQHPAVSQEMSVRKLQLIKKNQVMADHFPEVRSENAIRTAAHNLADELRPIFEATRAFKGNIRVEIQIGQTLILKDNDVDDGKLYQSNDWMQILNGKPDSLTNVIFTNILTTNGLDIDRMLEIKTDTESSTLWNKQDPGLTSTIFEFACQDEAGSEFILNIDQNGNHNLTRATSIIGQIALHVPGQIWDACAVVDGTMKFYRPSEDILTGVEQFKESLYMPGGKKASVYFRLPGNNAFTIKSIIMKRTSVHNCLLPTKGSIQLRITEVKALAHSSHPQDKKLYRSYESSHDVMIRGGNTHYEVAITDSDIERIFESNPDIEIGELTSLQESTKIIMAYHQAVALVEVTSYMLECIDWAGAGNVGTFLRMQEDAVELQASILNVRPPNLSSLPIPMGATGTPTIALPSAYQSQLSGTGPGQNAPAMDSPLRRLPGVRTGTNAEPFQDPTSGDIFLYGLGGARIPVPTTTEEGGKFDAKGPVLPTDSASQAGDIKRRAPVKNKPRPGAWDDKPAGFW